MTAVGTTLRSGLGLGRSLAIYYGRPWRQRALTRFYRQFLSPGDLAFDIGAHVGNRARAMRAAGARVVALEPQAAFVRFLRLTLPGDVTLLDVAAGADESEGALAVSRLHPTVSSLRDDFPATAGSSAGFGHVRWDSRQSVQVVTLDQLIAAHGMPRFVKIDVEGYEAEVLAGLSRPVPLLAFEYLPAMPGVSDEAVRRLMALGRYRFNVIEGEACRFMWREWRGGGAVLDWLERLAPGAGSGDIYARLDAGETAHG
jgi:FkbM family methyltransferase